VGAGLVGHEVGNEVAAHHFGQNRGGVAQHADGERSSFPFRFFGKAQGFIEVVGPGVEIVGFEAALDAVRVYFDDDGNPFVERDGERLCAPHATQACGDGDGAFERTAEMLFLVRRIPPTSPTWVPDWNWR